MIRFTGLAAAFLMFCAASALAAVINVPADQPTIQDAVNAAAASDTIIVSAGEYAETIDIDKTLTLSAAPDAAVTVRGRININATDVEVSGLRITNPNGSFGILVGQNTAADGAVITGNAFVGIGVGGETGETQGVWIRDATGAEISFNSFREIHSGTGGGAAKAILVSQSIGPSVSDAVILSNTMVQIESPGGGAYGVLATGPVPNITIQDNFISNVTGDFAAAISLDNDSLNAFVHRNDISSINATGVFPIGIGFNASNNAEVGSITLSENNFNMLRTNNVGAINQNVTFALSAENNWWGHSTGPYDPTGSIETDGTSCSVDPTLDLNGNGLGALVPGPDLTPLAAGYVDYCSWKKSPFVAGRGAPLSAANGTGLALTILLLIAATGVTLWRMRTRAN